jgi:hypothetical protein
MSDSQYSASESIKTFLLSTGTHHFLTTSPTHQLTGFRSQDVPYGMIQMKAVTRLFLTLEGKYA